MFFFNYSSSHVSCGFRHVRKTGGMEFVDPSLDDSSSRYKLLSCVQISLLCVQEKQEDRPSMLEISMKLNLACSPKDQHFPENQMKMQH